MRRLQPSRVARAHAALEIAVAVALLATSLVEIWLVRGAPPGGWGEPQALASVFAAAGVAPLPWRARRPVTCAAIVVVATALTLAMVAPEQGPFEPFVALVLAVYALGAHAPTAR